MKKAELNQARPMSHQFIKDLLLLISQVIMLLASKSNN